MNSSGMTVERLALRTIRALCLTAEASLHYFDRLGSAAYQKFSLKLPLQCSDYSEHIAQDVLGADGFSNSDRFVLENLLQALGWLAQFDRSELYRVTHSYVPTDDDLAALRSDVEAILAGVAD